MTKRNEQTGKKVASRAGKALSAGFFDSIKHDIRAVRQYLNYIEACVLEIEKQTKSLAASALTQSPDKPKRRK